ncbi:MAG: FtsW/RodA/SpoVE family cell cycle protein [Porphyromonadaceae bacterium]|nr:FtsW/RodA/SpoVE family cell cycle protein [Porphyromonadaceae bacterium]
MSKEKISFGQVWGLLRNSLEGQWHLWLLFIVMLSTSLLTITSGATEVYKAGSMMPILKHVIFLIISFATCWLVAQFPSSFYRGLGLKIYSLFFFILLIWLIIYPRAINDAARWVDLGLVTVQPSEFFKICLILWGALVGSLSYDSNVEKRLYFNLFWIVSLLCIAVFLFKNASTGLLMGLFLGAYSLIIKMPFRLWRNWVMVVSFAGLIFAGTIAAIPNDTLKKLPLINRGTVWKTRVADMFREETEDAKYDIEQNTQEKLGQVALAHGSLTGLGIGSSKTRDFLPMAYTDYVLSIMIEEWGIIAYIFLVSYYVIWFILAGRIAQKERNRYRKLLVLGIGLFFPMQALVNIAVVSGLFVTGQTLPLISWGGTSLLVTATAMGMLISISRTQQEIDRLEQQEATPRILM